MEAPASKETKLAMINQVFIKPQTWNRPLNPLVKMSAHINPVFTDRSVHMMMVVLALFHSDDQDESVRRVHEVINKWLWCYCGRSLMTAMTIWSTTWLLDDIFKGGSCHAKKLPEGKPWRGWQKHRQDTQVFIKTHFHELRRSCEEWALFSRCVSDLPTIMRLRNRIIEEGERINQVIF